MAFMAAICIGAYFNSWLIGIGVFGIVTAIENGRNNG